MYDSSSGRFSLTDPSSRATRTHAPPRWHVSNHRKPSHWLSTHDSETPRLVGTGRGASETSPKGGTRSQTDRTISRSKLPPDSLHDVCHDVCCRFMLVHFSRPAGAHPRLTRTGDASGSTANWCVILPRLTQVRTAR